MNIDLLKDILNDKKIAIIPTDTVYGLVGIATDEEVIKKIYQVKKRDYSKPLVILVDSINMLKKYVKSLNYKEQEIIEKFWPGPLTIIFKKNANLSNLLSANTDEIAIRMPDNKELQNLIKKINKPIIATSANISNKEVITEISLLEDDLKNNVDFIYDGGKLNNIASTIIKVEDNKIIFLREGIIKSATIEKNVI